MKTKSRGFSLIELLVVLAIIGIVAAFTAPAISSSMRARSFQGGVEKISATINLARQSAAARNGPCWVFFTTVTDTEGERVVVALVGSKDGTDPINWGTYSATLPDDRLELIAPILNVSNVRLRDAGTFGKSQIASLANEPVASAANNLSDAATVTINLPGKSGVKFSKAIKFSSQGASTSDSLADFVEFDLQAMRGTSPDERDVAVIRVNGITGLAKVYRP